MEKKPLILIVDDIAENLRVIGSILMGEKIFNILPATTGKMAIEIAKTEKPDLILLDVQMPEMDGYEVCKKLKADKLTSQIPIIFLTAKAETSNIVTGFEAGGDDYITKPFEGKEMIARVNTHLKLKMSLEHQQQLVKTKDKFFSIITHDLKGPLSAILHVSTNLNKSLNSGDKYIKEDDMENAKLLNESIKETFDLLENLLMWSRSQTGRIENLPVEQNLYYLTSNCKNALNALAADKGITLENKIPEGLKVYADVNLLRTIMRNLINNAVKFTHNGGKVTVLAVEKKGMVEVSVKDSGIGIDKDKLDDIFEINQRNITLGTNNEKGTGLGLVLCKEFAEKMGGEIWVKSHIGKGSQFTFSVPVK